MATMPYGLPTPTDDMDAEDRSALEARIADRREKSRRYRAAWKAKNWERELEARKRDYANRKEKYWADPERREKVKRQTAETTRRHMKKKRARVAARQKRVRQATPSWVDRNALLTIYLARPSGHEVDHIVPLHGRTPEGWRVCGLHVPWNLQYLPRTENRRKGPKLRPEDAVMPQLAAE